MNDGLIDAFGYNAWATNELILVCQELTEDQLDATATGAYGTIIGTLRHIVASEAGYYARLADEELSWDRHPDDMPGLDELAARNDELASRWDRYLSQPFYAERTFVISWHDGIDRDVPAGIVLVQAIQHGIEHRGQICTILTAIGVETPDYGSNMGVWDYAEVTNRAPRRET